MSHGYNIYLHGLKLCSVTCDVVMSYMNKLKKEVIRYHNTCKASGLTSHKCSKMENILFTSGTLAMWIDKHLKCFFLHSRL